MAKYEDLNRKEKDHVIAKYEQHRKFSRTIGNKPLTWEEFKRSYCADLKLRETNNA